MGVKTRLSSRGNLWRDVLLFHGLDVLLPRAVSLWYGFSMRLLRTCNNPDFHPWYHFHGILLETFVRSVDNYLLWNKDGQRFWFILSTMECCSEYSSRALVPSLMVMVSLRLGRVVRDSLGWKFEMDHSWLPITANEFVPIF